MSSERRADPAPAAGGRALSGTNAYFAELLEPNLFRRLREQKGPTVIITKAQAAWLLEHLAATNPAPAAGELPATDAGRRMLDNHLYWGEWYQHNWLAAIRAIEQEAAAPPPSGSRIAPKEVNRRWWRRYGRRHGFSLVLRYWQRGWRHR